MKENKYDDKTFFDKYSSFPRSVVGLEGAGEWHELQKMLPSFENKRVLDLGCGFGWHCRYAAQQGATSVVGIDLSQKMLDVAKQKTQSPAVTYQRIAIEDLDFPPDSFDVVLSSLAFHYVESYTDVLEKIFSILCPNGDLIFSVEHPVFTAQGVQDWHYDNGKRLHWPVDNYFVEGRRQAVFLDEKMTKYHRTLTTYVDGLIKTGFTLVGLCEPQPHKDMFCNADAKDELRRPMMLIVSAKKYIKI